ncbi:MAG: peptidylprolyl isomerase [Actinobacteria bacterium]|nr:MAG: peptidylprolyl isomerase [Actinomycetota bacterium]
MGKAQKLKQQRKEEQEKLQREERKKAWRKVIITTACIATVAVTVGLVFLVNYMKKEEEKKEKEPKVTAEMVMETSRGEIIVGLYGEDTPMTVQHITDLVNRGFYDGLLWYRVEDFVVQTGSHYQSLLAESGEAEPDEARLQEALMMDQEVGVVVDEVGLSNLKGAVGMAKPSDPQTQLPMENSATTDFYILKQDTTQLDQYFTIFGKVTSGMDVVEALESTDVLITATIREK